MKQEQEQGTYRRTKFVQDTYLMDWIGKNLPSAKSGFTATDLDLIVRDKSGRIMLIETKRRLADMKEHQRITFQILHEALKRLNGETINVKAFNSKMNIKVDYRGFKLIQFENTSFEDGSVFVNGVETDEDGIRRLLSFQKI